MIHLLVDGKQSEKFAPHGSIKAAHKHLVSLWRRNVEEKSNVVQPNDEKFYITFAQCFDTDSENALAKMDNSPVQSLRVRTCNSRPRNSLDGCRNLQLET